MIGLILLLVVGLILATFAAGSETALTSASLIRMRSLAESGDRRAQRVVNLRSDPNGFLSVILAINTVAVILASTAATLIIVDYYARVPEAVATILLSLVVLIFCEIAPKSLALRFNERIALIVSRPVNGMTTLLRPVLGVLTWVSTLLVRVTTPARDVPKPFVTEGELKMLVTVGEQEGVVEQEERQMIHGVLEMTDKAVREIMVPRVDVVGIEAKKTAKDLIALIIKHGHSRIPVYEETIDNIVSVVYAKDLLRHGVRSNDTRPISKLAREPHFTPEAKRVGELLHEMQTKRVHIAIVVDEHGGTAGIVTMEDLIEEIVGPIRDEYDSAEPEDMQFLSDYEVVMNARVPVDDVKEMLHTDFDEVEADSIGGLVYERLGEIPKAGATVEIGNATLTVESVRRQSIQSVRLTSPTPLLVQRNGREDEAVEPGAHESNDEEPPSIAQVG
ncbi:MAG TPA: hemolysin family protein [Candidatus Sulfotelmatobacter sp.]|nr:hemolysin family protein [Candidatus Sulfotelmatobacter sp.]